MNTEYQNKIKEWKLKKPGREFFEFECKGNILSTTVALDCSNICIRIFHADRRWCDPFEKIIIGGIDFTDKQEVPDFRNPILMSIDDFPISGQFKQGDEIFLQHRDKPEKIEIFFGV